MLIPQLERFLTAKLNENKRQNRIYLLFWLILSLCFAAVYIGLGIRQGFSSEYVIGDDAREYISWMYPYLNPELFLMI